MPVRIVKAVFCLVQDPKTPNGDSGLAEDSGVPLAAGGLADPTGALVERLQRELRTVAALEVTRRYSPPPLSHRSVIALVIPQSSLGHPLGMQPLHWRLKRAPTPDARSTLSCSKISASVIL